MEVLVFVNDKLGIKKLFFNLFFLLSRGSGKKFRLLIRLSYFLQKFCSERFVTFFVVDGVVFWIKFIYFLILPIIRSLCPAQYRRVFSNQIIKINQITLKSWNYKSTCIAISISISRTTVDRSSRTHTIPVDNWNRFVILFQVHTRHKNKQKL